MAKLKQNINLHILNNLEDLSREAANLFVNLFSSSSDSLYIVPGGSTPIKFYSFLARKIDNWGKANFILSDERLSKDKNLQNNRMLENSFLKKIKSSNSPQIINLNYNEDSIILEKLRKLNPKTVVLGLGEDGHTASLFPGDPNLFNKNQKLIVRTKNNHEDFYRVSLSFSYLMQAAQIFFIVNGSDKANVLKECILGNYNPIKYPAQFIFQNYRKKIHLFCDQKSAKAFNNLSYD